MVTNVKKDIIERAEGTIETKTVVPVNGTVRERKFSIAKTTDKMGITTGGALVKGFWWGLVIGAGVIVGIGMYKNKINLTYTK